MRRAVVLLVLGGICLAGAPAAGAAEPEPTLRELRSRRTALLAEIAETTDRANRALDDAAAARRRQEEAAAEAAGVRVRFASHAVGAYVNGVAATEHERLRGKAFTHVVAEADRRLLEDLKRGQATAVQAQRRSRAAAEEAERALTSLGELRQQLEQTIATRAAAEAAAAAARQRAVAAAQAVRGGTRTVRATLSQGQLMATYPFGPVAGIPTGLAATGQVVEGKASWYGPGFDGRQTASGAVYDQEGWTVAHRTLPLGTMLIVSRGGRSVLVLVNDRGPYVGGRVLDLSHGVAKALGTVQAGVAHVRAVVVAPA